MEAIGVLEYNPKAIAKGSAKTAILRRRAHSIACLSRLWHPFLSGKLQRQANRLHSESTAFSWVNTKKPSATAEDLQYLYDHCKRILLEEQMLQKARVHTQAAAVLKQLLLETETDLNISREEQGWCILRMPHSVVNPAIKEMRKQGLHISKSIWGPHVSVTRGEHVQKKLWGIRDGEQFKTKVFSTIKRHGQYRYVSAECPELHELRAAMGLSRKPKIPFHITIGKVS